MHSFVARWSAFRAFTRYFGTQQRATSTSASASASQGASASSKLSDFLARSRHVTSVACCHPHLTALPCTFAYLQAFLSNPVVIAGITSGTLSLAGDLLAQVLTKREQEVQVRRSSRVYCGVYVTSVACCYYSARLHLRLCCHMHLDASPLVPCTHCHINYPVFQTLTLAAVCFC
jgi:hypothetical protein